MPGPFSRSARVLGQDAVEHLHRCSVAVFGLGGVGSHACEALARSGVGRLIIIDADVVDITNLNRQSIALHSTIGRAKTDVMREKLLDINPEIQVEAHRIFYGADTDAALDFSGWDAVVDAIDTVSSKLLLIERAAREGVPVISSMGTGNKKDPLRLTVGDIYETSGCPLARIMRRELRKRGVPALRVVYSTEEPCHPFPDDEPMPPGRRQTPGSLPFVPPVAGLIIAAEVVSALCGIPLRP